MFAHSSATTVAAEHQRRAAGFGVEEVPHGRRQVPPPGGPLGERECAPVGVHGEGSSPAGVRDDLMRTFF